MVNSMTAFATARDQHPGGIVVIELRSYNHRYLDANFRLPDLFRAQEPRWREQLRSKLSRGKLDCQLRFQPVDAGQLDLSLDQERLDRLVRAMGDLSKLRPELREPTSLEVLQWPGVLTQEDAGEDELLELASSVFSEALDELCSARAREGDKLAQFILARLEAVADEVAKARAQLPELLQAQKQKLQQRLSDIQGELDPQRLEQELVMMAQKADVDEELDRLEAHIGEVRLALEKGGAVGRRLDFLMQEFNREANTLSSKSIASTTTQNAVELKVLIEQMREQIQNLE